MKRLTAKDLRFARRLKRLRRQKGLTQEDLAYKTHLSTTFIGLLETGMRRPSLKTLQKIAIKLDVKAKDLIPY